MSKLNQLLELAKKEKIDIHYLDIKEMGVLGLYVKNEGLPHMIFLDNSIKNDKYKLIEVLSEELGHYFTSIGNSINNIHTYRDKLIVGKCENKATKWATNFLVNEDDIIKLINNNITCIYEMADIMGVSVEILMKKFEYLSKTKQMIDLKNEKYLNLTNLPNLIIYNSIKKII